MPDWIADIPTKKLFYPMGYRGQALAICASVRISD
jgi:hypothetical protein